MPDTVTAVPGGPLDGLTVTSADTAATDAIHNKAETNMTLASLTTGGV